MTSPKAPQAGHLDGSFSASGSADAQANRQEGDRPHSESDELTKASKLIDALRPGAIECMAQIMVVLAKLPRDQVRKIVQEIRELGESGGIHLGDLDARYECDHIDGLFSGQQMFCMLHCGMKLINPNVSPPSGLDREYERAKIMTGK